MSDRPSPAASAAARRPRWLAELAQALDQANRLTFRLRECNSDSGEVVGLHARILALRSEIDWLQRGRSRKKG